MLETDADEFDCGTCPVLQALDALWPVNRRAWNLSRQLFTRFLFDGGGVGTVLVWAVADIEDPADKLDMVERLSVIYHELHPLPAPSSA